MVVDGAKKKDFFADVVNHDMHPKGGIKGGGLDLKTFGERKVAALAPTVRSAQSARLCVCVLNDSAVGCAH